MRKKGKEEGQKHGQEGLFVTEWEQACQRELETLSKRKVFEVVKRHSGRKVIKNRWVFDVKDDGQKQ